MGDQLDTLSITKGDVTEQGSRYTSQRRRPEPCLRIDVASCGYVSSGEPGKARASLHESGFQRASRNAFDSQNPEALLQLELRAAALEPIAGRMAA
jgi:hypothetical protein